MMKGWIAACVALMPCAAQAQPSLTPVTVALKEGSHTLLQGVSLVGSDKEKHYLEWQQGDTSIKLNLFERHHVFYGQVSVAYQSYVQTPCLGGQTLPGCHTGYAGIDTQPFSLKGGSVRLPVLAVKDGHSYSLSVSVGHKGKGLSPVLTLQEPTYPHYAVTVSLSGIDGENVFHMAGGTGQKMAYGASVLRLYPEMLRTSLLESNSGIVGAVLLTPKNKGLDALIGIDSSTIDLKDYKGGDPTIKGVHITVKTSLKPNGQWVPFKIYGHKSIYGRIKVSDVSNSIY